MLSAHKYGVNRAKADSVPLDDLDGLDILAEFEAWAAALNDDSMRDEEKKRFVKKPAVFPAGRLCMLRSGIGYWGDPGREVVDSANGEISYVTTEDDASTVPLRAALVSPPASTSAFFFIEREGHSAVGSIILDSFKAHLRNKWKEEHDSDQQALRFTIEDDAYTSSSQWFAVAEATRVQVSIDTKTGIEDDDALKVTPAHTQTTVSPEGMKFFPGWVKSLLMNGEIDRALAALRIEIPDGYDGDPEISLTMTGQGREKTFMVNDPKTPSVSLLLHDHGSPALNNTQFAKRVLDEATSIYSDRKLSFLRSWFDLSGID